MVEVPKLAFLGPKGTYSHQAGYDRFGDDVIHVPKGSIRDTFNALGYDASIAIIPYENSIHGAVTETLDLLQSPRFPSELAISETVELAINHCLMVKSGASLQDITSVYSHEQALSQCAHFIQKHLPRASLHKTTSTAAAAEIVGLGGKSQAAICSIICAKLFPGLEIFQERIQNDENNHTRFLIIRLNEKTRLEKEKSNVNEKLAALIRLSFPSESNLTSLLQALSLPVRKIDRRACIPSRHFEDVYVAEILDDRRGRTDEEWTLEVGDVLARVRFHKYAGAGDLFSAPGDASFLDLIRNGLEARLT